MTVRVDRMDCATVQANDARDLTRSGRVTLEPAEGVVGGVYTVEVDGTIVGCVVRSREGWVAGRIGWHDPHPRSKRSTAVRRLLMSWPRSSFDRTPAATVAGEGNTEGGTFR